MKQLIIINSIVLVMISLIGCSVKNKAHEETKSENQKVHQMPKFGEQMA